MAKNFNANKMSESRVGRILVALLLATICGVTIIAGHTNSFRPNSLSVDSSANGNNVTILPKLNRAKRVAIYNGQGVIKVCHKIKSRHQFRVYKRLDLFSLSPV